jgi:DNA-binding NarL/FixJ family response regulator
MSDEIRLVIADDHPILRQGLRHIIEREVDLHVLAEADDGEVALENIITLQPDVAVLDVDMPKQNGFAVLRALTEKGLCVGIIMLTVHCEEEFFNEALRLGARGYVLKDSAIADIVSCIRAVAAGENYVSPTMTKYLFKRSRDNNQSPTGIAALTPTEKHILQLIADYKTNNQIAEELFISPHTVKTHRKNICTKLHLEGNHALMKFALEHKATFYKG